MERTTRKQLEFLCARINAAQQSPATPYERLDGSLVGQIGNYHLSGAYGGVSLHKTMTTDGGVCDVFGCGHVTKRDLYIRMSAYLAGVASC